MSLLNGGIVTWLAENRPVSHTSFALAASEYPINYFNSASIASADFILSHLNDNSYVIIDSRSANEFLGLDNRAGRAGHIPGAVNIDWLLFKDANTQKLIETIQLEKLLHENGVTHNKEIIVHCHSHHRSALCYVALKHLGYKNVRGYPASWSDWATRTDTPVEI